MYVLYLYNTDFTSLLAFPEIFVFHGEKSIFRIQ